MFYLRSKDNISAVYLFYRKTKRGRTVSLKYYPGITVDPGKWNQATGRINATNKEDYKINLKLDKISHHIQEITADWDNVTSESLRDELQYRLTGIRHNPMNFATYCGIKVVKTFDPDLKFEDINADMLRRLARWMEQKTWTKNEKGYKKNYIAQIIAAVKRKYKKAVQEGIARPVDLNYSYAMEPTSAVYLSEKELEGLYAYQFKRKNRELIRDVFLVGCYTGMRAGNYLALKNTNINTEEGYIETIMNKRGGRIRIPIHRIVREIIAKYNGIPRYAGGINTYNKVLRRLCKEAGLNQMVLIESFDGGEQWLPKYELISSHTARRSIATNLYLKNVPLKFIMAITGHRTEQSCLLYIRAGVHELYDQVSKLDFWK